MNNYNELIGELVEFNSQTVEDKTGIFIDKETLLGIIVGFTEENDPTLEGMFQVKWLVGSHEWTWFRPSEINRFGLFLKHKPNWRS